MLFINPQNEYPRHVGDIQILNPNWQVGDPLPAGWLEVVPTENPDVPENKVLIELAPVEINGVWTQVWSLRDLTAEELERRTAPATARQKLKDVLGLTDAEIEALVRGLR
jgi:hypothetical protein